MSNTTTKPSHTQGEWKIMNPLIEKGIGTIIANDKDSANFYVVAECNPNFDTEANAARIVKCVNMHDELVKSLKECYDLLRNLEGRWEDPKISGVSEQQYRAYKLLKKAEQ